MELCWVTLHVNDLEASLDFYTRVMALPVAFHHEGEGRSIVMLGEEDKPKVELIHGGEGRITGGAEGVSIGLQVPSLDQAMEDLREKGVSVEGPIAPNPSLRFCFITDPDGVTVQLVERPGHE
jgi:lactoylglutathione lyase